MVDEEVSFGFVEAIIARPMGIGFLRLSIFGLVGSTRESIFFVSRVFAAPPLMYPLALPSSGCI